MQENKMVFFSVITYTCVAWQQIRKKKIEKVSTDRTEMLWINELQEVCVMVHWNVDETGAGMYISVVNPFQGTSRSQHERPVTADGPLPPPSMLWKERRRHRLRFGWQPPCVQPETELWKSWWRGTGSSLGTPRLRARRLLDRRCPSLRYTGLARRATWTSGCRTATTRTPITADQPGHMDPRYV